jgi:hypothetical protein
MRELDGLFERSAIYENVYAAAKELSKDERKSPWPAAELTRQVNIDRL